MHVYLDMDGVLVDLWNGFVSVSGYTLKDKRYSGNSKDLWKHALETPKFWESLDKMHDADRLLEYVAANVDKEKLKILSATSKHFESCETEKRVWVGNHTSIDDSKVHVVERAAKKEFAVNADGSPNVLIDDYEKNIKEWEAAGGIGVHHTCAESTIEKLKGIFNV